MFPRGGAYTSEKRWKQQKQQKILTFWSQLFWYLNETSVGDIWKLNNLISLVRFILQKNIYFTYLSYIIYLSISLYLNDSSIEERMQAILTCPREGARISFKVKASSTRSVWTKLIVWVRKRRKYGKYVGKNGYISNSNIIPSTFIAFYISLASLWHLFSSPARLNTKYAKFFFALFEFAKVYFVN